MCVDGLVGEPTKAHGPTTVAMSVRIAFESAEATKVATEKVPMTRASKAAIVSSAVPEYVLWFVIRKKPPN
jgi:hypothetical protein